MKGCVYTRQLVYDHTTSFLFSLFVMRTVGGWIFTYGVYLRGRLNGVSFREVCTISNALMF